MRACPVLQINELIFHSHYSHRRIHRQEQQGVGGHVAAAKARIQRGARPVQTALLSGGDADLSGRAQMDYICTIQVLYALYILVLETGS